MAGPHTATTPIPAPTVQKVKDRLKRSVLSPLTSTPYQNAVDQRTYVENPYSSICRTHISKAPPNLSVVKADPAPAEYLLPAEAWQVRAAKDPTMKRHLDKSQEERTRIWLESAKSIAERPALPGFCNLFSMVTVAILVSDDSPLEKGTLVEWLGAGSGATGHMVAVVNRDPQSDVADPDTWGDNYLVIDYWYALQAGVEPVFLPRRKTSILAKGGNATLDAHETFRVFFEEQGKPRLSGRFTVGAYKPFKIKPMRPGLV